jgi:hypothetical protein
MVSIDLRHISPLFTSFLISFKSSLLHDTGPNLLLDGKIVNDVKGKEAIIKALGIGAS